MTQATLEVFEQVSKLDCIKGLFLCGGTGQSLQMDHRLSEDLDFELLGVRKDRPDLDFSTIINEMKQSFPDTRVEILGEDHFLVFVNGGKVKLSFYRPENPVQSLKTGWQYNNLKAPTLQELLGMKIYTICLRLLFRDYYDIYCLLEAGCDLDMGIAYASYLSRHTIRSKTMYSRMLSPHLFLKDNDFQKMSPKYDVSPEDICARIKQAMEKK
ncbi:MAG: nucleotidyl transferase AbiEii/AbiGii toxin family protein [Bacteroidales bacterium]|nr:nucleotidyl transferase AbiEii/AbiGii toxin family protein [Bacteroidales bacterium]